MFAVIEGNPDGVHSVTLWSTRERAEAHATQAESQIPKMMRNIDYVRVVRASQDDGRNFIMNEEL